MRAILVITIAALSALVSCKKVKMPANTNELMGEWKVVNEPGGWGTSERSDGKTTFKFTKQGRLYVFENHILKSTRTFHFTKRRSIYSAEQEYIIDYDKGTDQSFKIEGNTLYLNIEAADAGGYVLTRK